VRSEIPHGKSGCFRQTPSAALVSDAAGKGCDDGVEPYVEMVRFKKKSKRDQRD
jgi:hypothetical protein